MIQINLIHDQKIARVAAVRPSGAGFKFALPRLPFNVGMVAAALLFVAVIAASIVAYTWQQTDVKITNGKIKRDSLKIDSLNILNVKVQELKKNKEEVEDKLNEVNLINQGRFYAARLIEVVNRCLPNYLWLTLLSEDAGKVIIEGSTFSNLIVVELMDNLKSSRCFSGIELTQTSKADIDGREMVKFSLTGNYKPEVFQPSPASAIPQDPRQPAKLTLSWSRVSQATNYIIHVSASDSFNNLIANQRLEDTTSFTVNSGLEEGKKYFWRVQAFNGYISAFSDWSNPMPLLIGGGKGNK
ncbi:PilN domain-containing protein [candidate division TA06 bacterium]|uniref:PilN domain-containing protein n=1 Tax=candidate division TA06 bacterium TaxID=2250710 RepID=A0A933IDB6_UNCT6|nr:PilN domain-containing protein [candidate division TA06 bacterium]